MCCKPVNWVVTRVLLAVVGLSFTGCSGPDAPLAVRESSAFSLHRFAGGRPIKAVCTTGMVGDLVRHVGGRHVEVTLLMKAGVDPHLYKASPGDITLLGQADIIFYSGRNLEGKLGDLLGRLAKQKATFAVADALPADQLITGEHGHADPHVWFDVELWRRAASYVAVQLALFDEHHADDYLANAHAYQQQLRALHEETRAAIQSIPESRRVLITAHDAFRYFGRAYGIKVVGIQGISTEDEASVKRVNELVEMIVQSQAKAVFVESSVPERNMRSLIEGCRSRGHDVAIGGELFSDALGPEGTPEGTYVGMVRHNVRTMVQALR
jgi:manganese/zinc/iron transport system substrate-binding protein